MHKDLFALLLAAEKQDNFFLCESVSPSPLPYQEKKYLSLEIESQYQGKSAQANLIKMIPIFH